jgi:hypothetical protein
VHDQQRRLLEQVGGRQRVQAHQLVQRSDRDLVAPVRAARALGAVVVPRLLPAHRGRSAIGSDRRHPGVGTCGKEAGERVAIGLGAHRRHERARAVVGAGDSGDRAYAGVERGGAHRVPTAEADAEQAHPVRVDGGVVGEEADRRTQVGQLAGGVLVLGPTLALAEPAVVKGERSEAGGGQALGVQIDDLLLDAGERAGQHHARERARLVVR